MELSVSVDLGATTNLTDVEAVQKLKLPSQVLKSSMIVKVINRQSLKARLTWQWTAAL